jgi:type III pantothenate kinase
MRKSSTSLYLADIGNTNVKFWRDGNFEVLSLKDFTPEKFTENIFYISVNQSLKNVLSSLKNWTNLESFVEIDTNYKTLGIDRKVAIYGVQNGIVIDMGSAITIDVVKNSVHLGGYILLGKSFLIESFREKIPNLSFGNEKLSDEVLPEKTGDALLSGFYHQLVSFIRDLEKRYKTEIVFTGGDSEEMSEYFPNASFDKNLIFNNMRKVVEKNF